MEHIAPNLNLFVWRPVLADPPLCTVADLKSWVTLADLYDMHEAMDLRSAMAEKKRSD